MSYQLVLCSTYNVSYTVSVECGLCTLECILGEDRETMCYHCTQLQEKKINIKQLVRYYMDYPCNNIFKLIIIGCNFRIGRASVQCFHLLLIFTVYAHLVCNLLITTLESSGGGCSFPSTSADGGGASSTSPSCCSLRVLKLEKFPPMLWLTPTIECECT